MIAHIAIHALDRFHEIDEEQYNVWDRIVSNKNAVSIIQCLLKYKDRGKSRETFASESLYGILNRGWNVSASIFEVFLQNGVDPNRFVNKETNITLIRGNVESTCMLLRYRASLLSSRVFISGPNKMTRPTQDEMTYSEKAEILIKTLKEITEPSSITEITKMQNQMFQKMYETVVTQIRLRVIFFKAFDECLEEACRQNEAERRELLFLAAEAQADHNTIIRH